MNLPSSAAPTTDMILTRLRASEFAQLDDHLGAQQAAFEAATLSEKDWQSAFSAFEAADPAIGEAIELWREAVPGSYPAHVALATWLLARAWAFRGRTTSNLISDRGRRGMEHFLEQAEGAARYATSLSANPLLAWLVVGRVHNTLGCDLKLADLEAGKCPDWYSQPLRGNPASLLLRQVMLQHLRTEWGGSEAHMLAFVRAQAEGGLSSSDQTRLWAQFHGSVAHHARFFGNDLLKSLENARMAADLHRRYVDLLLQITLEVSRDQATRRAALDRWLETHEQFPEEPLDANTPGALIAGRALLPPLLPRLGRVLAARAADHDHEAVLSLTYLHLTQPSLALPDPLPFLERARDQGDVQAAELYARLLPAPGERYRRAVLRAAELGSSEMNWTVYSEFAVYQREFELEDRARYRFLLRAADTGENDARVALAELLRAGQAELGDDGVLRPVMEKPLQESLDYARHLLERAAAEEHPAAAKALKAAKASDWNASSAPYNPRRSAKQPAAPPASSSRPSYWWILFVLLAIGRIAASCNSHQSRPASWLAPPTGAAVTALAQPAGRIHVS
jgi:Domain of unknown function (DUF4034)